VTARSAEAMARKGGILLLDKPAGPTSHDCVDRIRRVLGERRVGHTGTLDPFASGLLVLCVGPATRLSEYLTGLDKEYLAELRLGQETATHDTEGAVLTENDAWQGLERSDVEQAMDSFRGPILQIPPGFSAKKIGGEAAYRKARRGERVDLPPVEVTVYALEIVALELPFVRVRVHCSSGTYVRGLARDLGAALGTGAHLTALRRTSVGAMRVEDAVELSEGLDGEALLGAWIEPPLALAHLSKVAVDVAAAERLARGQAIAVDDHDLPEGEPVLVLLEGTLVAIATRQRGALRPQKVLAAGGSSI